MLVQVVCPKCDLTFGVEPESVKSGNVVKFPFHCCYCDQEFKRNDVLKVKGIQGGVNIGGSVHVSGDIVGGDLIK